MAFLCNECHKASGCTFPHMVPSYGRCESCGKTGDCVDCKPAKVQSAPGVKVLALHVDPDSKEAEVYDAVREAAQGRYYLSGYPRGQRESVYVASVGDLHFVVCGHDPVTCRWMHVIQGNLKDVLKHEHLEE